MGPLWNDRDTDEIVADLAPEGLPTFLNRFSPEHSLTYSASPLDFARELERRWFERYPPTAASPTARPPSTQFDALHDDEELPEEMASGSVFVSYAREDRAAAFQLADQLTEQGLEVWVDRRLAAGDAYRRIIERNIVNCSAFVAVLSATTRDPSPRWYRREWSIASKQNEVYFGTNSNFVFPVLVDGTSSRDHTETLSLFGVHGVQAARAPAGVPDEALVTALQKSQRLWRKQHSQRS
jgi:TIR domain